MDFDVVQACPGNMIGVLQRQCKITVESGTTFRSWGTVQSTCENPIIAKLATERITVSNMDEVLSNLSGATRKSSILSTRDVNAAADVISAGVSLIEEGEANLTNTAIEAIVFTASDLMGTSRQALHAEADSENRSVGNRVPILLDTVSEVISRQLEENKVVQVKTHRIQLTIGNFPIDKVVPLPVPGIPEQNGLSSCELVHGSASQCSSTGDGLTNDDFNHASLELPPLKHIIDMNADHSFRGKVRFAVYSSDAFFNNFAYDELGQKLSVNSPIVVATVSNSVAGAQFRNHARMKYKVRHSKTNGYKLHTRSCRWYQEDTNSWSDTGCRIMSHESDENVTTCECEHLTSFAVLMDLSDDEAASNNDAKDSKILSYITYVGVGTSVIFLTLMIIVFSIFPKAINLAKRIQLHIAATLIASLLLYVVATGAKLEQDESNWCFVIKSTLHYALLSAFFWMGIQGYELHQTFVKVFDHRIDEATLLRRFAAIAYGIPLLIAGATAAIDANTASQNISCWLSGPTLWAFAGPILGVIGYNIVVFVRVMRVVLTATPITNCPTAQFRANVKRNLKATVSFFSIMGITWLFGLLSLVSTNTVAAQYLFCILNAFTGLWMFIFHCWLDPALRVELNRAMHRRSKRLKSGKIVFRTKSSGISESSNQNSIRSKQWREQVMEGSTDGNSVRIQSIAECKSSTTASLDSGYGDASSSKRRSRCDSGEYETAKDYSECGDSDDGRQKSSKYDLNTNTNTKDRPMLSNWLSTWSMDSGDYEIAASDDLSDDEENLAFVAEHLKAEINTDMNSSTDHTHFWAVYDNSDSDMDLPFGFVDDPNPTVPIGIVNLPDFEHEPECYTKSLSI